MGRVSSLPLSIKTVSLVIIIPVGKIEIKLLASAELNAHFPSVN